LLFHPYR